MDGTENNPAPAEVHDYPDLPRVTNFLETLRRRWFYVHLGRITLLWVALLAGGSTALLLVAGKIPMTPVARWVFLMAWLAGLCSGPVYLIYLLIFSQPSPLALARLAETQGTPSHNNLTNALQLSQDPFWSPRFVAKIIAESAQSVAGLQPETILPARRLRRPALTLGVCFLLSFGFLLVAHQTAGIGFAALFHPSQVRPPAGLSGKPSALDPLEIDKILQTQITARFPGYLQQLPRLLTENAGALEIPEGTELEFILRSSRPVKDLHLTTGSNRKIDLAADSQGRRFRGTWTPSRDDGYALAGNLEGLQLHWPSGQKNPFWPVRVVKDLPPTIRLAQPGRDMELPPGAKIVFTLVAEDDHAVSRLKLFVNSSTVFQSPPQKTKHTETVTWIIPANAKIGSSLDYWAEARDNRDLPNQGPQTAATQKFHIKVVASEKYREAENASVASLRDQLQKILKKQIHCRSLTLAGQLPADQSAIRQELETLANQKYPAGLAEVERILKSLVRENGPATQAAQLAGKLTGPAQVKKLLALQEEIILTLESLLAMLDQAKAPAEKTPKPATQAGDLSSPQKMSDLLGKFIDQQRQAIKSGQDLAKKNPDDFSAGEKAQLDALKQLQEKWDRFLQQATEDMDKLAKQDFSASVTKQELVEIQSQVQLAEKALEQKAVKMAIKAEEVGLELAKELLHNLERWNSDVPDRLKWELEEPPAPIDVPLAELPEELEDIVGDLIEKEEDLYDEIEDTTSSWSDSLDAGAGWGVMDGPISNYSAKGITGNLLPNQNEIGGRSGEGRTGRSSGEFVEQTAQGKGGRRTPTRLTKDAFQPGQVDDRSKEPAGGATGGGKLSGAGAEGLTGPGPRTPMPNLPALKEKQALLLAKAKMAQLQARKNNWGNFELDKTIRLMAANRADLDKNAYRSVLARKNILIGSLKNSRTLIAGKFQLDRPEQILPQSVQAQIRNTDPQAIPENLRPILNRYYELLARPEKK
jgi:hypothetical protein